jgi:hypothetical protein
MTTQEAIVREQLEARLAVLTEEFEKGQTMLREAELRRAELEQTLVRIDGARQVLLELLSENGGHPEPRTGDAAQP